MGGTPVQGSEEIVPTTWVLGPPTHVQRMSPNSAALALLTGFAEGSIQMQGGTVKHLNEGNMEEMKKVTIELIQPDGKLIDKIENVDFLDRSGQSDLVGEELLEIEIKQNVDSNLCSMVKEKKGKNPDKLSPAAEKRKKAAEAREKNEKKLEEERLEKERVEKEKMEEELRQKEEIKKKKQQEKMMKPKPPPKSGLGSVREPTKSSLKLKKNLPAPEQPTRSSPRSSRKGAEEAADPGVIRTPETPLPQVLVGDDEPTLPTARESYRRLMQNPQINPQTGRPYTSEAEKRAIRFLMEQREEAKQVKERRDESSEDETPRKGGKMSKDLIPKRKRILEKRSVEESPESSSDEEQSKKKPAKVAKKRVGGGVTRKKRSRKGATPTSQKKGKKVPSKIPSKADSGRKHGGLLPGTVFACGTGFYTTDDQGRVFNQYGERVYQAGEVQTVEETDNDDDDLGVTQLQPDDDDDDEVREGQGRQAPPEGQVQIESQGTGDQGGTAEGEGQEDDEEEDDDVSETEVRKLEVRQEAEAKKKEEKRRRELAERCRQEVSKIRSAVERGGRALSPKRRTSRDLQVKRKPKVTHRVATKASRKQQPMKRGKGAAKKTLPVGGGPTPSTSRTGGMGGTGVKRMPVGGEGSGPSHGGGGGQPGGGGATAPQ